MFIVKSSPQYPSSVGATCISWTYDMTNTYTQIYIYLVFTVR
jgi:hypothetical protein